MIKLGDKYRICKDKYNWTLQEKRVSDPNHHMTKSVKEKFVDIGYFGKIEHLINSLINKDLLKSDINTLQELQTTLFQTEKRLKIEIESKL